MWWFELDSKKNWPTVVWVAAVAWIQSVAGEVPHAMGAAKKKREREREKERPLIN